MVVQQKFVERGEGLEHPIGTPRIERRYLPLSHQLSVDGVTSLMNNDSAVIQQARTVVLHEQSGRHSLGTYRKTAVGAFTLFGSHIHALIGRIEQLTKVLDIVGPQRLERQQCSCTRLIQAQPWSA